jgi:hypothetical protein
LPPSPVPELMSAVYLIPVALSAGRRRGDRPGHAVLVAAAAARPAAGVPGDPARVLGNSAGDATLDAGIRAGRPIVVDAGTIIDWAIWIDGKGIVEGGQTNVIAQGHAAQG